MVRQTGARGGFTLVEVAVALVVLELGAIAALGLLTLATANLAAGTRLERASGVAELTADSLSAAGVVGSGEVIRGPWRVRWSPDAGLTKVRVGPLEPPEAEPVVEVWVP